MFSFDFSSSAVIEKDMLMLIATHGKRKKRGFRDRLGHDYFGEAHEAKIFDPFHELM